MSEEDELVKILEAAFTRIRSKLDEIEERVQRVENRSSGAILTETKIPELRPGILNTRSIYKTENGIQRIQTSPTCQTCGASVNDSFIACQECGKPLCKRCSINYNNRNLCIDCLKTQRDLSKRDYFVLKSIASEVTSKKMISELTRMSKDDVKTSLIELLDTNLIVERGVSIYKSIHVTDEGLDLLSPYQQVYAIHEDVKEFELRLQKHISEKDLGEEYNESKRYTI